MPTTKAPKRLFVQLTPNGGTVSYLIDPREIHDNGKPAYKYRLETDAAPVPLAEDRVEAEKIAERFMGGMNSEDILNRRNKCAAAITTFAARVRAEQREVDAKVCEGIAADEGGEYTDQGSVAAECAEAIRKGRSQ